MKEDITKESFKKEKLAMILAIISIIMLIISNILTPILNKSPNDKFLVQIWFEKMVR